MSKIECYLNYQLLGRHIQSARKARNITQEMLAERMNVSLGHIGKIERGERLINLERLAEISILLRVPIEDLIAGCIDRERDSIPVINALTHEKVDVIYTLLKGQPEKVVNLATTIIRDIVNGLNEPDDT